jgi:hypothetical protein
MELAPASYDQQLAVSELTSQYDQLTERMWDMMDLLHAIQIGRAALAQQLKEARRGTREEPPDNLQTMMQRTLL